MICDHFGCKNTPMRAPRVLVPSQTPLAIEHPPLRMFTSLHYCEVHKGEVKIGDLLSPKVKADFEEAAKRKRPIGFKCDFEAATIEYVLITTPEYRRFQAALGVTHIRELANDPEAQRKLRAYLGAERLANT